MRGWTVESRCFWIAPAPAGGGMLETASCMEPPLHRTPTTRRSHFWQLHDRPQAPVVQTSVAYLERTAPTLTAPWSLAWSILALAAHHRPITLLRGALLAL